MARAAKSELDASMEEGQGDGGGGSRNDSRPHLSEGSDDNLSTESI
eukprot:CAMPEP_0175074456 /NCGR_PEP_ID=MMETSP0052_2-20121109/21321_1 /TAXON_ID=51329 ORGANISM="Polytomella parva, Strain SAG 63-3" /NCGR_SAMPLE_ID=MMETSP0052_2 /ASSEMBLY_ACC=CAM_ASM_000194 /LENGTH=45 /DNA_ID= /DNA_START= /DNA_END= /DNA_ORIENTATION=